MSNIFAKLLVKGVAMATKIFFTSYQQAAKDGRAAGANTFRKVLRGMQPDEAMKVLNIESKNLNKELLEQQYTKYFESNNPSKGGSFYLQSKIYRAKETLDRQLSKSTSK